MRSFTDSLFRLLFKGFVLAALSSNILVASLIFEAILKDASSQSTSKVPRVFGFYIKFIRIGVGLLANKTRVF